MSRTLPLIPAALDTAHLPDQAHATPAAPTPNAIASVRPAIPAAAVALAAGITLAQVAAVLAVLLLPPWPPGAIGTLAALGAGLLVGMAVPVLGVRALLPWLRGIPDGPAPQNGRAAVAYGAYRLLLLFQLAPWLHGQALPAPLRTAYARACGARIGRGSTVAGIICDPPFTSIGDGCLVGLNAILVAHAIGSDHDRIARIHVGHGCLVGAGAQLLAGTRMHHAACVAAGAIVTQQTSIPAHELWGGVPARRLRSPVADASMPDCERLSMSSG